MIKWRLFLPKTRAGKIGIGVALAVLVLLAVPPFLIVFGLVAALAAHFHYTHDLFDLQKKDDKE